MHSYLTEYLVTYRPTVQARRFRQFLRELVDGSVQFHTAELKSSEYADREVSGQSPQLPEEQANIGKKKLIILSCAIHCRQAHRGAHNYPCCRQICTWMRRQTIHLVRTISVECSQGTCIDYWPWSCIRAKRTVAILSPIDVVHCVTHIGNWALATYRTLFFSTFQICNIEHMLQLLPTTHSGGITPQILWSRKQPSMKCLVHRLTCCTMIVALDRHGNQCKRRRSVSKTIENHRVVNA